MNPYNVDDMLKSHKILMNDLTNESGRLRSGGIFAGEKLVHMAPAAAHVPNLIRDLVDLDRKCGGGSSTNKE